MTFEKTITINYRAGHSYDETWGLAPDMFCPHCGKHGVWIEQSPGDYYVGQQHICMECRWTFQMPMLCDGRDEYDQQRIAKLSSEDSDA